MPNRVRREHEGDAVAILEIFIRVAKGENVEGYGEIKASDRVKAGSYVVDQVMGKAVQQVAVDANVGVSPEQIAILAAIKLTPHERRQRLAEIAAEDDVAIAEADRGESDPE